jgi:LuxR family maltose regulon positive regulatory protein
MENLEEAHRHNFIATLTEGDRYILDYLIEEVLDRQPAHIQNFLLHTSILERLSGPLCDAVLSEGAVEGRGKGKDYFPPAPLPPRPSAPSYPRPPASGQTMLEYLEHNNLFVVPLDNRRQWYRYHHLFADLLHNQLEASQPELEHTLHRRASAWYEQNDLMSEAIAHSLAAQDVEQAARLTEQTFDDMMSRDEFFTTMLERLEALPDEIIRARPRLGILYAWMLSITLQLDGVEPRLQEVERLAGDQLPTDLRLQITHIRAELARYRNLAFAYLMMGDVVKAQQRFSEALTLSRTVGSITLTLVAMTGQAQVQVLQGHLQQAAKTYRQALQLADEVAQQSGRAVPATAYVHLGMGGLLCERNNLDEAARHLAQGLELAQQWQIDEALRDGYIFQTRVSGH